MNWGVGLPGRCSVCGAFVRWRGRHWRDPGTNRLGRIHVCPQDRALCGAFMPYARERCARKPGHTTEHRTAYALENAARMRTGVGA